VGVLTRELRCLDDRSRRPAAARRGVALLAAVLLLGGCASTTDFDAPKDPSSAYPPSTETRIGRSVARAAAAHPGDSGFYLLSDGIEALAARLVLARRAGRSIDAQYYFMLPDITSYLLLAGLLDAADRGVRVRLLLDDIQTQGYERGMAALDSHPHFEIRIFNPFSRRQGKVLDVVGDFERVNRRMHNKSFTVDSQATIVGGRNIGAEYFAAGDEVNFGDLDLLGFGPVAVEAGTAFDAYWNSDLAVPVSGLLDAEQLEAAEAELPALRERIAAAREEAVSTRYDVALRDTILDTIDKQPDVLVWAPARLFYDSPEKAMGADRPGDLDTLRRSLGSTVQDAQQELLVVSPYFVPLERGVEAFRRLRERGVEVAIVTNSFAATDVKAVHGGYAPYRKDLLEAGVRLYEYRPDRATRGARRAGLGMSEASLHAKFFVIDRRRLFVGSFNWDPRSVHLNTEMGILVDSPELAEDLQARFERSLPERAYRLMLNDAGKLRWLRQEDGDQQLLDREPETGFWDRVGLWFLRRVPIRSQL